MADLWMPPAIIEPVVIEAYGTPEIYCNGGFPRFGPEVVEIVLYCTHPKGETVEHLQCGLLRMPRSDYEAALLKAVARLKAMAGLH